MKRWLVAGAFAAALGGPVLASLRRRRPPKPRQLDVVCGVCFRDLEEGDAYELRVFDAELGFADLEGAGGTYMTGYFCGHHRPDGSIPSLG